MGEVHRMDTTTKTDEERILVETLRDEVRIVILKVVAEVDKIGMKARVIVTMGEAKDAMDRESVGTAMIVTDTNSVNVRRTVDMMHQDPEPTVPVMIVKIGMVTVARVGQGPVHMVLEMIVTIGMVSVVIVDQGPVCTEHVMIIVIVVVNGMMKGIKTNGTGCHLTTIMLPFLPRVVCHPMIRTMTLIGMKEIVTRIFGAHPRGTRTNLLGIRGSCRSTPTRCRRHVGNMTHSGRYERTRQRIDKMFVSTRHSTYEIKVGDRDLVVEVALRLTRDRI